MQAQVRVFEARLALLKEELESLKHESRGTHLISNAPNDSLQGMKAAEVIVEFLRNLDAPISKKRLKQWILDEGYPPQRFGKGGVYYYVALNRLVEKGKILKEGDEIRLMG